MPQEASGCGASRFAGQQPQGRRPAINVELAYCEWRDRGWTGALAKQMRHVPRRTHLANKKCGQVAQGGTVSRVQSSIKYSGTGIQRRQPDIFSQSLTIGVWCSILEPHSIFAAWRRPLMVYLASDARLADHPAQCDAASMSGFRTLHANNDRIDSTYKFIGYRAARRARHFTDIHRHPKVLATRTTRQARVVLVVSHIHENTIIVLNAEQLNDFAVGHLRD